MKPQKQESYRPVDLARAHGLSAQAVRNYERDGSSRRPGGRRAVTAPTPTSMPSALRAYVALVPALRLRDGGEIMSAGNRGDLDTVLARRRPQPCAASTRPGDPRRGRGGGATLTRRTPARGRGPGRQAAAGRRRRAPARCDPARRCAHGSGPASSRRAAIRSATTGCTTPMTYATPNWPSCSGAAATCWATSRRWSATSVPPPVRPRWTRRCGAGGRASPGGGGRC